jgi:hypothetical protein
MSGAHMANPLQQYRWAEPVILPAMLMIGLAEGCMGPAVNIDNWYLAGHMGPAINIDEWNLAGYMGRAININNWYPPANMG